MGGGMDDGSEMIFVCSTGGSSFRIRAFTRYI
jgi:hypothetical protein